MEVRLRGPLLGLALLAVLGSGGACGRREASTIEGGVEPDVAADGGATPIAESSSAPRLLPVRRVRGAAPVAFTPAARMAHHGVAALDVAVVESGAVVERRTVRLGPSGELVELDAGTLFPGGALGTPVASALVGFGVVQWAADQHVELDAPLSQWVASPRLEPGPEASSAPPTMAQILGHSSGLAESAPPSGGAAAPVPRRTLRLVDAPGRRHRFAPVGTLLLRDALLRRGGFDSLEGAMETLVFEPWGLASTSIDGPPVDSRFPPAAPVADLPSSDLWTTAADLARWAAVLAISARGVAQNAPLPWPIARRALEPGPGGWAWGVRVVEPGPRFEVATEGDGLAVLVLGFVDSESGAAVMAVAAHAEGRGAVAGGSPGWLAREVARGLAAERGWPGLEVEELEAAPPAPVARALVGRYRFDEGDLEIRWEDGELIASAPPGVLGPERLQQSIHPLDTLHYVFLERPERLEFVRRRGEGVRGLMLGERRALRVGDGG